MEGVHVREYGDGGSRDLVVCLHGLGGSALNFSLVAPRIARGRRVLVPDLLGHGRSSLPPDDVAAVTAHLRMIARLLESEPHDRLTLVGHSMGGVLAAMHAAEAPATVDRLVLLDPPVPRATGARRDLRLTAKLALLRAPGVSALVARQATGMTPEQVVARQLADATPHADLVPPEVVAAAVAEVRETRGLDGGRAAQRSQYRAIVDIVALFTRPGSWRERLAGITAPVLWLQGEDDELADVDDARALAAVRPDWVFLVRPGVGHLPHLEDPDWTVEVVMDWLAGQP